MASGPPLKRLRQTTLNFGRGTASQSPPVTEGKEAVGVSAVASTFGCLPVRLNPKMDGSCQFQAASDQLHYVCGKAVNAETCRMSAVDWISKHRDEVEHFIECSHGHCDFCWAQYCSKMRKATEYGDHITLLAMSHVYDVQWVVLSSDSKKHCIVSYRDIYDAKLPILILGHDVDGCHYVSLGKLEDMSSVYANVSGMAEYNEGSCVAPVSVDNPRVNEDKLPPTTTSCVQSVMSVCSSDDVNKVPAELCRNSHPTDLAKLITDNPVQPRLSKYPHTWHGSQNRSFASSWYGKYPFIEYSIERDAVFCFACRLFPSSLSEPTFVLDGFRKWKTIGESLKTHSHSRVHQDAMARWGSSKVVSSPITKQLDKHACQTVEQNRQAVATLARVAVFCARQDLPLRGHRESNPNINSLADDKATANRGNFTELVELLKMESCTVASNLDRLPQNASYDSHESQNDLLTAAADIVRKEIVDEVKSARMFSVIVDEARDMSKTEQMSICLRYIVGKEIKERFLGFVELGGDLSAPALAAEISNFLKLCGLDLKTCISQCYDGASVMSGPFNGVQSLFRQLCGSPCLYIHCYAHRVNLVLVDTCKSVSVADDLFGLLEAVHNFISVSSIRHEKFASIQRQRGEQAMEIPLQCDTRWVCKLKAVSTFKKRFHALVACVKYFAERGKSQEKAQARGLLLQLRSFKMLFFLHLLEELLLITNSLSVFCQGKQACISSACSLVRSTICSLSELRCDDAFTRVFQSVVEQWSDLEIDVPDLCSVSQKTHLGDIGARKTKLPSRFRDTIVCETVGCRTTELPTESTRGSSDDSFKRPMFEIVDTVTRELKRRFSDTEPLLVGCDAVNPNSEYFMEFAVMKPLVDAYAYLGIDTENLRSQSMVAKNMFVTEVKPSSVVEVITTVYDFKAALPDLYLFVKLVSTIPVSSAGAERSFSAMKRVKGYLRSTMSSARLNNLCLLSIERSASARLLKVPESVVTEFASQGNRRIRLT